MLEAVQAIRERAEAQWPGLEPGVPMFWPNDKNRVPDNAPFLYAEVVGEYEDIAAMGGGVGANEWVWLGRIQAVVLVPANTGVDIAYRLAKNFASVFRGQRFNSVSCFAATISGGDKNADKGNYWQLTVAVDFSYRHKG